MLEKCTVGSEDDGDISDDDAAVPFACAHCERQCYLRCGSWHPTLARHFLCEHIEDPNCPFEDLDDAEECATCGATCCSNTCVRAHMRMCVECQSTMCETCSSWSRADGDIGYVCDRCATPLDND